MNQEQSEKGKVQDFIYVLVQINDLFKEIRYLNNRNTQR